MQWRTSAGYPGRGVLTALAIILVGFGFAVAPSPGTAKVPREFFGVVNIATPPLDNADRNKMRSGRVGADRFALSWRNIEPSPGRFRWRVVDQLVGGLAAMRIRPVPWVWGSPAWVAENPARAPLDTAADRKAWRTFLAKAVNRYGPGGTYWSQVYQKQFGQDAKPKPIRAWQIWNEPNLAKFQVQRPPARPYARLLRISHNAIVRQDRKARILLGGLVGLTQPSAWNFLARLYRVHGIKRKFDAVALHPYAYDLKQLRVEIRAVRAVMRHHGERRTPLWLTELGWGSEPPSCRHCANWLNRGLKGQKRMLSGAFRTVLKHRSWRVKRLFWFRWRDPKPGSPGCGFCSSAGLLRYDGSPKPAYRKFRRLARAR